MINLIGKTIQFVEHYLTFINNDDKGCENTPNEI